MSPSPKSAYDFSNDVSGRLFCWLIDSGKIDLSALMAKAKKEDADNGKLPKRLAKAIEEAVQENPGWVAASRAAKPAQSGAAEQSSRAPAYSVFFRPDPPKKIQYKEVAKALLKFAGDVPSETL